MALSVPSGGPAAIGPVSGLARLRYLAGEAGALIAIGVGLPVAVLVLGTPIVLVVRVLIAAAQRL